MKNSLLSFVVLGLLAGGVRADVMLGTSNPASSPLTMTAGATSGPMFANIVSGNVPNDVMVAWNIGLEIVPDSGATGTLAFQHPSTGASSNPPNYVFGANGLGIVATNGGSSLSANDFFDPSAGLGVSVSGAPGANLLQMDFLSSSSASGLFGIYAVQGVGSTLWTDQNFNTRFFTNVPDGTGRVLIGEVLVAPTLAAVPLPSPLAMAGVGILALSMHRFRGLVRRRSMPSHYR